MSLILQQLIVLYVFLSLGWLFGTKKPALREQTGLLSFLLVNLLLPCKVFLSFSTNFTAWNKGAFTFRICKTAIRPFLFPWGFC